MPKPWVLRSDSVKQREMENGAGSGELAAAGETNESQMNASRDMASGQQMTELQVRLRIAELAVEQERLALERRRRRCRQGETASGLGESAGTGGRTDEDRRLRFANLLKGVLAPMPLREALVPGWFEDVEATLGSYEVPTQWWAGLILPQLSEGARGLLTHLSAEERSEYALLKAKILDGLRLTAAEYKRLYSSATKVPK